MSNNHVPLTTVHRLPIYLRCLLRAQGQRMALINSVGIAEMAGTNAAQVRKDLSYLGEYGTRGVGYDVDELAAHLARWLGIETARRAAIVGYGRLGSALQGYSGFAERGVHVVAVLDADPAKVGMQADDLVVESIDDAAAVVEREGVEIAILTVPVDSAQQAAQAVADAGVKAILNFAPVCLEVPDDIVVRQADMAAELQILSFHLNRLRGARSPE